MKIGELETRSGTSRHTLRYYEQIGLIAPLRQTNNYRVYTEQTLQDLDFIQRAQSMGFALGEIGEILDAQRNKLIDCADGAKLIEKKMAEIKQKITNLQGIYRYLDEERANLEASAAKQLELQQLNNSSN
ncbi:DNA-binding transcriptional regulator, MerR family [Pseudomonas chlororaphis]|uniref:MerR family transcriptional regulator n=1 Tax=Pseudomonas chlororaphis TaxID=587753 RepID=UPI000879B565|nr:MerR family transcriptional regulator [Pseudomonas chlororaphis]AZD66490.1 Transcriptional regulator, MerR family [Pseudomonas chlororaphis subsp. aurantiaca]QIT22560.1 MerR family transcriptional regulator [Pseudomonas chlororaphis subsp. aurantiaca]WDH06724.1 MerR family transcriptional regulator [Pseudomonas chlororaphis]WDH10522.1 MerR family transcriptional regulator [Pseudomonas chlororaphis]SDT30815.1 DNA-binding transcriptional regulator, MerR family [Pseudomonas chlororaphis]